MGSRYPVDANSFSTEDWLDHFSNQWERLCYLKEKYDSDGLLTAVGINILI